ncbi:MAG: PAS domain-containing protein, partial [bacterium]|nr:PAS domain-containing protein [bacterium]
RIDYLIIVSIETTERKQAEETKEELLHDIGKRYKELHGLYEISKLAVEDISLEQGLQKTCALIPPAWQYPEITCARIIFEDLEFETNNFRETEWVQSSDIFIRNTLMGVVEVYYREKRPELDEGPFLKDERKLIDAIAKLLGIIIERKQAGKKLSDNQALLEKAEQIAHLGTWKLDPSSRAVMCSDELLRIFGISRDDAGDSLLETNMQAIHPDDRANAVAVSELAIKEKKPYQVEYRVLRPDGTERNAVTKGEVICDDTGEILEVIGVVQDITESKNAETKIIKALKEKEALLRELYHRTKNNMAVIISMLNLQSRHIDDEKFLTIITEIKNRIHSMALVHKKLYESKDLSKISLKEYIADLAELMMDNYRLLHRGVMLKENVEDVYVSIDNAIPIGLVLHELISNAFKYAFPGNTPGEISINLHSISQNEIELTVSDNGVGLPKGFEPGQTDTLGLRMVVSIVEYQMGGKVSFENGAGLSCRMRFTNECEQRV